MLFGQAPARVTEQIRAPPVLHMILKCQQVAKLHVLIAKSFEVIFIWVAGYKCASRLNLNKTCQHSDKV